METPRKRKNEETNGKHELQSKKMHMVSADALHHPRGVSDLMFLIWDNLDDCSLLTCLLVCKYWNAEITSQNVLWKLRGQRKKIFHDCNFSTIPLNGYFSQYISLHRAFHLMKTGEAFQVDEYSETLDCFHRAREDKSLSQIFGTVSEDRGAASENILPRRSRPRPGIDTAIALTGKGELIMTDMQTKKELWKHEDVALKCYDFSYDHIHSVTNSGEVKQFSLEGHCEFQLGAGGILKDPQFMSVHPACRFMLVGLKNDEVYILVKYSCTIKLQLTYPAFPDNDHYSYSDSEFDNGSVSDYVSVSGSDSDSDSVCESVSDPVSGSGSGSGFESVSDFVPDYDSELDVQVSSDAVIVNDVIGLSFDKDEKDTGLVSFDQDEEDTELVSFDKDEEDTELVSFDQDEEDTELVSIDQDEEDTELVSFDQDEEDTELVSLDKEKIEAIGFISETSLDHGQLAIYLQRYSCVVVAIIDEEGKILHQASKTFDEWYMTNWTKQPSLIIETHRVLEKYSVRLKSSGIDLELAWERPLPSVFESLHDTQVLRCGDQFILGIKGTSLVICRLDNEQQVSLVPGFFKNTSDSCNTYIWSDASADTLEHIVRKVAMDRANQRKGPLFFLANTAWLDGLSPDAMTADVPIVLFLPDTGTAIRCLRWSADLWS